MSTQERETRIVEFERLNLLGKAVFLSGAAVRLAAGLIESAIDQAATLVSDVERAYRQGQDPNVEDARILDERDRGADSRLTGSDPVL